MASVPWQIVILILALGLWTAVRTDTLDMVTMYRFHEGPPLNSNGSSEDESTIIDVEFHTRNNALGRMFLNTNNSLYPCVGMPPLGCDFAGSQCLWYNKEQDEINSSYIYDYNRGWISKQLDMSSVLPQVIYQTVSSASVNPCSNNNGGCQHSCQEHSLLDDNVACSCPKGYSLLSDTKSCKGEGSCNSFLYGTTGRFASKYHPGRYLTNMHCSWLIVTKPGFTITLSFTTFITELKYDWVKVYDGDNTSNHTLGNFSGSSLPGPLTSSENMMLVTFDTDHSNNHPGFTAVYTTAVKGDPVLALSEDEGTLTSLPVQLTSNAVCVSIIYKLASDSRSKISMTATLNNDEKISLPLSKRLQVDDWQIGRFKSALPIEYFQHPVTLSVTVAGKESAIYSIVGCNPDEDEDVFIAVKSYDVNEEEYGMREDVDHREHGCYNGGLWYSPNKKCICLPGFIGDTCEEGCGANSYGNDCGGLCSGLERGCKGIIFKLNKIGLICAPGFKGLHCNNKCSPGEYGNGCHQQCGHCSEGICDPYTGKCPVGCHPGFYPPLCQETYKVFREAPTVTYIDYNSTSISTNLANVTGRGTARIYQIQYKELASNVWSMKDPEMVTSEMISGNITDLKSGFVYQVRIILIDRDGNSCQDQVPATNVKIPCQVPVAPEYNIKSVNISSRSFAVTWEFAVGDSKWCPVTAYEVVFQERWHQLRHQQSSEHTSVTYTDLIPGWQYVVRLRAITELGKAIFSEPLRVTTADDAPSEVVKLVVVAGGEGELEVSWNPPRFTGGTIRHYHVNYQCLQLLACSTSCNDSKGQMEVTSTSVVLSHLFPHAQYSVQVAGLSATRGPYTIVEATTDHSGAAIHPDASPTPIIEHTNTSLSVQWEAAANCSGLNGFFRGYRYELVAFSDKEHPVVRTGTTSNTNISFTDLVPHTEYHVLIYIVTSGGWNANNKLDIRATTTATIPDKVQELTVYKKGRRMIGLRWAPPLQSYGSLKSFTVAYHKDGTDKKYEISETIEPIHCAPWPHLFCHTINRLTSDTSYTLSVQARNTEIDTDGQSVTVSAITREGAPGAPTGLKILNHAENSFVVEWKPPSMINGVLRSFLVNVEETDSVNASECCKYFPIQELPVHTEDQSYRLEVLDLSPASTHTISIAAKTVTMGPTVNITGYTRPRAPVLLHAPEVVLPRATEDEPFSVTIRPVDVQPGLRSTYLLLVLPPGDAATETTIWDEDLSEQLREAVGHSFYLVGEYQSVELRDGQELNFGTGASAVNGTLGTLQDPHLTLEKTYRVGVALVLDYCGAKSVGFLPSEPFLAQ